MNLEETEKNHFQKTKMSPRELLEKKKAQPLAVGILGERQGSIDGREQKGPINTRNPQCTGQMICLSVLSVMWIDADLDFRVPVCSFCYVD